MAQNTIAYIATETTITVLLNGQHRTIQVKSKQQRNDVIKALEKFKKSRQTQEDLAILEAYLSPIKRITLSTDSRFELDESGNKLYLAGTKIPIEPGLASKILDFLDNRLPIEPLVKFWISCLKNPHFVAVQELFKFLENNNLPITDDGGFLGYKKLNFTGDVSLPDEFGELFVDPTGVVRYLNGEPASQDISVKYLNFISELNNPTMKDVWSGTISQKLGDIVKIERVKLGEEERRNACGYGLHIGSFSYNFDGNVRVLCKVFPEDVIACNPNERKLRTCKYQIVSFVDPQKEVSQLLVDLSQEEKEIANGDFENDEIFENPFNEGEIVKALQDSVDITTGSLYYITNIDADAVCVVNNKGEEEWYDYNLFESR